MVIIIIKTPAYTVRNPRAKPDTKSTRVIIRILYRVFMIISNSSGRENYNLNKLRVPIVAHRLPTNFYLNFLTMFRQRHKPRLMAKVGSHPNLLPKHSLFFHALLLIFFRLLINIIPS
jgi:hypothetical protein